MSVKLMLISLFVGFAGGATGVGGVLLIPAVMYFGGLGTHQAMATALCTFFFNGMLGAYLSRKRGSLDFSIAVPVCIGASFSSYLGAILGAGLSETLLQLVLSVIIVSFCAFPLLPFFRVDAGEKLGKAGKLFLLGTIGVFSGVLSGLTGAGGAIIAIPLMLIFGFNPLGCIATGQFLSLVVSFFGSIGNYYNGFIDFDLVWKMSLCGLLGVKAGVSLIHAVPVNKVKPIILGVCIIVGLYIGWRALTA